MKFHIKQIKLWFKNNSEPKNIDFLPNKVNVITGASGTGKSSILSIIDYCLLSSEAKITEEIINESVSWYGLIFSINNKEYVIVRECPRNDIASKKVYFSSSGVVPDKPQPTIDIKKLKSIIEHEFGIDENLKIQYGGKKIASGSKISFRYFLLFNTLSEDTIANTNTFFDFDLHNTEQYIEALDRIFFLAIGVDDVNNVLYKERLKILDYELEKIEKKKKALTKEERLFGDKIVLLLAKAQEYDLIERQLFTVEEATLRLSLLVDEYKEARYSNNLQLVDDLNKRKREIWRKIRNLERFNSEYDIYKETLKSDYDSLLPIEYLRSNFQEIIPTVEVKTFINTLENTLLKIKKEISNKRTISFSIKSDKSKLENELSDIEKKLKNLPTNTKDYISEIQKYIFIGELKSQLNFYKNKWNIMDELSNIEEILDEINEIKNQIKNTEERKKIALQDLTELIQKYFNLTNSMGVYQSYKVYFDEVEKVLKLRKPQEASATTRIGSKSNYMFLHLCLFLGLHEHIIAQKMPYVPQFLILDQPSQPYYEGTIQTESGDIINSDDKKKLQDAFALLDKFISIINSIYKTDFQIILFEHAPKDYWENPKLNNFYLVDEYRDGNALIPERAINNTDDKS